MPVFVTKPQNRLNSDNPPEGGLAAGQTDRGTSRVKDSEIKSIIGSDCAEGKLGESRCIGKTSSLSAGDWKIWGLAARRMFNKAAAEKTLGIY